MKTMRWTACFLGLTLGLLLFTGPLSTFSRAAGSATIIEFRSPT